jgi:hypothetical protein
MKNFLIKLLGLCRVPVAGNVSEWYRDTALMSGLFGGGTGSFAMIAGDAHLAHRSSYGHHSN